MVSSKIIRSGKRRLLLSLKIKQRSGWPEHWSDSWSSPINLLRVKDGSLSLRLCSLKAFIFDWSVEIYLLILICLRISKCHSWLTWIPFFVGMRWVNRCIIELGVLVNRLLRVKSRSVRFLINVTMWSVRVKARLPILLRMVVKVVRGLLLIKVLLTWRLLRVRVRGMAVFLSLTLFTMMTAFARWSILLFEVTLKTTRESLLW